MQQLVNWLAKVTIPDLGRVFSRFPIAAICALLFSLFLLFDLHKANALSEAVRIRLPAFFVAGFLWSLAASLFAEARPLAATARWSLAAAGLVVLAVLISFAEVIDLDPWLLLTALALLAGLAAYIRPSAGNPALWQFNHHFWIGWLIALVATVLFAGGVSLILESLRYLFGLPIPAWMHEKVWVIGLGLVAPLNWLALVPEDLQARVPEGEQPEFTSRAVAMLVRYVLVPLLFVFAAILHAYALKIAFEWNLPKGRLGYMVLSFGAVLAVTAFAAFPTRNVGGWLVDSFWRVWPWLLPVPVVLLFVGTWQRIAEYGLTERRYFVVLAGIWLVALFAAQGRTAERRDLRWPMALLAALLAIAAAGPWGMVGASTKAQASGLIARLTAAGVIKAGRVPENPRANFTLLASDRARVSSAIAYLAQRDRLNMVRPLFQGIAGDPFLKRGPQHRLNARWPYGFGSSRYANRQLANDIHKRLGLTPNIGRWNGKAYVSFNVSQPASIEIDGSRRLVGVLRATRQSGNRQPRKFKVGGQTFATSLAEGAVNIVETASGRMARYELSADPGLRKAMNPGHTPLEARPSAPLRFKRTGGDLAAELLLINASGRQGDRDQVELEAVGFWLSIVR